MVKTNIETICKNYNILIDATDSPEAHLLISDIAVSLNKPLVYTTAKENSGNVAVLNYKNNKSFNDLALTGSVEKNSDSPVTFCCQAPLFSIIGAIASNEVIKVILGLDTPLNEKILNFNLNEYSFTYQTIS